MSDRDRIQYLTDHKGQVTHAVVPIKSWEQVRALLDAMQASGGVSRPNLYAMAVKNITARGYPEGVRTRPYFVLVRDSEIAVTDVRSLPPAVRRFREQLYEEGALVLDPERNAFRLTRDLRLKSPSFAAELVSGNVRNGLESWVNHEGFNLRQSGWGRKIRPSAGHRRKE